LPLNLQNLPPADRLGALRQRRARVLRSQTRAKTSRANRRAHGPKVPSWLSYTAALRRLIQGTWDIVLEGLSERIAEASRQDDLRGARAFSAVDSIKVRLMRFVHERAPAVVDKAGKQVSDHNVRETKRVLGIDPRIDPGVAPTLDVFRRENVRLIESIAEEQLDRVTELLDENLGLRVEDLSKKLRKEFDVTKSRADLIARDQTLKLNGDLTRIRQTNAGIAEYIWTTSGDERVREEHAALEGLTQRWDVPPAVGHPGEDYQCRCTAYPVVPGLDEDE
jgi:SPP1 gp7 family putative phage head morphogenesis protein